MQQQLTGARLQLARALVMAVLFLAVWGLVELVIVLAHWVASLSTSGVGAAVLAVWAVIAAAGKDHGPEWITGIATAALVVVTARLWLATRAVERSTNVAFNAEGPYLNLFLYPDVGIDLTGAVLETIRKTDFGRYSEQWKTEDSANVNLAPVLAGASESFVNLIVSNRSTKVWGLAAAVSVDATLWFGATSSNSPHPFSLSRTTEWPIVETNMYVAGRLFNVANLGGYVVTIDQVRYKDGSGRERRAASGVGVLTRTPEATRATSKIFPPRKGEYTDAVD